MKKILFISHDASRTGAPIVLLQLIKWLKVNKPHIYIDTVLITGGELEQNFIKHSSTTFNLANVKSTPNVIKRIYNKIASQIGFKITSPKLLYLKKIARGKYDVIYVNTVVALSIGVNIKENITHSKLLVHVHELNTVIKQQIPNIGAYKKKIDGYIAASHLVKNNLVDNWNISAKLIEVIYEFSNVETIFNSESKSNIFTVGASGGINWRKGFDVFIQVAYYVKKHYPNAKIEFTWVGKMRPALEEVINSDIDKLGLEGIVLFVGSQNEPEIYYNTFDVFLMSSREDPFPLVCIEVAMLSKPIICFEKATGTAEILIRGGGFIVPYLDIEAMGEKLMYYYNNPNMAIQDGKVAYNLFAGFTPDNMCPKIYEKIISLQNS